MDKATDRLYVSSREVGFGTTGMLMSLSLKELKAAVAKNEVIDYNPILHRLLITDMPNGMAFSPSKKHIVFVQTMKDKVSVVEIATKKIYPFFESKEDGWLDGLIYLPDYKLYLVVDSKLGKMHFFNLKGQKVKSIKVLNLEGSSTGLASIARRGDRLYITDMWLGDLTAKAVEELTGSDKLVVYHSRVYNFSLKELLSF